MNNLQLRRHLRQQRRQLSPACQQQHARSVLRQVKRSNLLKRFKRFAIYLDADGELQTGSLINHLLQHKKNVLLPALYPFRHNRLWFLPFHRQTVLKKNRFMIKEPTDIANRFALSSIDVIFMPLVGFDEQGNRLGMGGGFYDRTLAPCKNKGDNNMPLLIGLAHELQKVSTLKANSWDIALDGVITESNFYCFTSRIKQFVC